MALILGKAARLKPDIRLAQAVSEFEADLYPEQKSIFRSYRNQSIKSAPNIGDVMQVTAEIDRGTRGKISGGRCFGPRLTNILQAVQQFAALGDVIIGGSQNLVACGVWSLVRMTLLSLVTISSHVEKLSMLFMTIGRSSPRYEKLGLLYPHSKNLQSYTHEYYIVIVHLCHHLLRITRKSMLGQALSLLNESDVKTYQSDLSEWANAIKDEVTSLMARGIEEQKFKLSEISRLSASASHQHRQKLYHQVLESCSTYDYQQAWKQIRKAGTSTLLVDASPYQEWKVKDMSSTLIYKGKLGSGKSVLLANIVDDLNIHVQGSEALVTYFFCRHDSGESLKARTIIGCLARQLLLRSIPDRVAQEFEGRPISALDADDVVKLLQRALQSTSRAYFVMDGIDECDIIERNDLLHQLQKLQRTFALQICFSSRSEASIKQEVNFERFANSSFVSMPEDNPDIENYIYSELGRRIECQELVIGDPEIVLEIQDTLQKGAHGMFLWVALQIDSLCFAETDKAILKALEDLPKDLPETFIRILQRSQVETGSRYQKRILELCAVAYQPLSTEQLREALSVEPLNTTWDPSRLINDIFKVLSCCGSLVVVDEEDSTVRLVHHSFKQFMLGGFGDRANVTSTKAQASEAMVDVIITYMSYSIFDNQLSTVVVPQVATGALPSKIIRSTIKSSSIIRSLTLKVLQSQKRCRYNIGHMLVNESGRFDRYSMEKPRFSDYAKPYWFHHVLCCLQLPPKTLQLLARLLERGVVGIDEENYLNQVFQFALQTDHEPLIRALVGKRVDINALNLYGRTPLHQAVLRSQKATIQLLVDNGANMEARSGCGNTALYEATADDNGVIVRLLLDNGAYIDSKSNSKTPLHRAIHNNNSTIVQLLFLREGPT